MKTNEELNDFRKIGSKNILIGFNAGIELTGEQSLKLRVVSPSTNLSEDLTEREHKLIKGCIDALIELKYLRDKDQLPASVPTDEQAATIALSTIENLQPKLTAQQEAFYVAGFQECVKYFRLNHPPVMGEAEKEQQIFFTYDKQDGEVFCAFTDEERARKEAEECTAGLGETRLVIGKRTPTPSSQHLTGR